MQSIVDQAMHSNTGIEMSRAINRQNRRPTYLNSNDCRHLTLPPKKNRVERPSHLHGLLTMKKINNGRSFLASFELVKINTEGAEWEREIWLDNETSDWILNMERCC
jgi:hypothetical protein